MGGEGRKETAGFGRTLTLLGLYNDFIINYQIVFKYSYYETKSRISARK